MTTATLDKNVLTIDGHTDGWTQCKVLWEGTGQHQVQYGDEVLDCAEVSRYGYVTVTKKDLDNQPVQLPVHDKPQQGQGKVYIYWPC